MVAATLRPSSASTSTDESNRRHVLSHYVATHDLAMDSQEQPAVRANVGTAAVVIGLLPSPSARRRIDVLSAVLSRYLASKSHLVALLTSARRAMAAGHINTEPPPALSARSMNTPSNH
jgi:hypothetical protein